VLGVKRRVAANHSPFLTRGGREREKAGKSVCMGGVGVWGEKCERVAYNYLQVTDE